MVLCTLVSNMVHAQVREAYLVGNTVGVEVAAREGDVLLGALVVELRA